MVKLPGAPCLRLVGCNNSLTMTKFNFTDIHVKPVNWATREEGEFHHEKKNFRKRDKVESFHVSLSNQIDLRVVKICADNGFLFFIAVVSTGFDYGCQIARFWTSIF